MYTSVKTLKGYHLTQGEKVRILLMLNQNIYEGRIGRTDYFIKREDKENCYHVQIVRKERRAIGADLSNDVQNFIIEVK